jgi:hypothetical protein
MDQAIDVRHWYLNETQSLLQETAVPPDMRDAIRLDE